MRNPFLWLCAFAFFAGAAIGFYGPAMAQTRCGDRAKIVSNLATKYGETRRSFGVQNGRGLVETFASVETGTWTIIASNAQGFACIIASGQGFGMENTKLEVPS